MRDERFISVVIPNRNGAATLRPCLEAAFASDYRRFEVVLVDDASEDGSGDIARGFPCKLVRLDRHSGVSRARNAGARASAGELLFFIDSDCLLRPESLALANAAYGEGSNRLLGGTYTPLPYDQDFFSAFQSVFIHHFETKSPAPDYVAAHAMVIDASLFRRSGGFVEGSFIGMAASVEDVEYSHRLRRAGFELALNPHLQVQHYFRFSLKRSLKNAFKKSRYWTLYSLANRDLLSDSGAASLELKANVLSSFACATALAFAAAQRSAALAALALLPLLFGLLLNRKLMAAWRRAKGTPFTALAALYYSTLYAAAVALGGLAGASQYLWSVRLPGSRLFLPRTSEGRNPNRRARARAHRSSRRESRQDPA
jgi:glycosyltransferase involved in cell wall biosynthesis